jgi:DNA polymerase III delta prime subunit
LHDLFITDPADDRKALERRKGHRAPGTCSWILETDELKNWLQIGENGAQKESNIFWLYGNPGTGKSTMAITLTEELPNHAEFLGGKKRLAYFFCDSGSEHQRTATSILRGLLYQLITQHKSLMKYLLPKYTERKAKLFTSFDALWSVLIDMGQDPSISGTYCIVDALDECEPDDQWIILHEIDRTFSKSKPQHSSSNAMRFLITSRPYPEIRRYLSSFSHRDLSAYPAVTADLKKMIQERVARLSRQNNYPRPLMTEISRILEQRAEGTFLWVGIACDELKRVQARKAVKTLQHLPKGLYFLYQKLLDTATTQCDEDDKPVILKLVRFVAIAQRPFTIPELYEACELHVDDDEASRFLFTRELIDSCGFIIIAEDGAVRLLHGSVRDFLKDAAQVDELKSHAALAERCIASILGHYRSQANGKIIVSESVFLDYSVSFWPIHAGLAKGEFMLQAEQATFFKLGSEVWTNWLNHYNSLRNRRLENQSLENQSLENWRLENRRLELDPRFSIFHAAARWGIDRLISWGCDDSNDRVLIDRHFRTGYGVTPLEEGARHGKISTVGTLLRYMSEKESIRPTVIKAAARNSENGRDIMRLLLEQRGDQIQITEDVVTAAAGNESSGEDIMALLLKERGHQIQITEDILKAAAGNESSGKDIMTLLLKQRGDRIQITEDVVKAAARNLSSGKDIMALLLKECGHQIQITEDILKAAAGNLSSGEDIMALLLEQRGDQIQITEDVVKAAAKNRSSGKDIMTLLLEQRGDRIQITEDVVKAAAGNRSSGKVIMTLLLEQRGDRIQITEGVVKAAAGNESSGKDIITLLLEQRRDRIQITEGVVKAAAGNESSGKDIIALLLEQCGDQIQITEDMVKAAAGNRSSGEDIMALLRKERRHQFQIPEDILKAAAGSHHKGKEIMTLLLEQQGKQLHITENAVSAMVRMFDDPWITLLLAWRGNQTQVVQELIKAAAPDYKKQRVLVTDLLNRLEQKSHALCRQILSVIRTFHLALVTKLLREKGDKFQITETFLKAAVENRNSGKGITKFLLGQQRNQFQITEELLSAAAQNKRDGKDLIALLLHHQSDNIHVTEGVLKAASENTGNGLEIIKLLLDHQGGHIQITKDVLKAAAGNTTNGMEIIKFLLDQQGDAAQVTEDVLEVAAGNTGNGTEIITFLLGRQRQAKITEEVLKAAAENELSGQSIMELLLGRQGDVMITERIITAAAGNRRNGKKVLELLFEKQGEQIKVTEELIKAAAGNEGSGVDILAFLFDKNEDGIQITDGVLLSAASSGNENVLALLSSKIGLAVDPEMLSIARLYNAAKSGETVIVEQLLSQGTPPDTRNMRGVTPLGIAASNGHQEVVRVLLQTHQVDVNIPSIAGRPPIFCAAANGHTGVVRLLLQAGASPRVTDTKGDSPYNIARKRGHWDTAELLEEHLDTDVRRG